MVGVFCCFHSVSRRMAVVLSLLIAPSAGFAHPVDEADTEDSGGVLSDRFESERRSFANPYVVSTHKQNYVLPVSYTSSLNSNVYEQINEDVTDYLNSEEVKFQLNRCM